MVPLYALIVSVLSALNGLLARRAARVERKYSAAALAAQTAVKGLFGKPGNASHTDPLSAAKRQYELGRLVEARDRQEAKYVRAQARADGLAAFVARLTGWKGRAVPYLAGVADVALMLTAAHYLGLPHGLTPSAVRVWAEGLKAML